MIDAVPILQLLLGLFADDLLEITHHGGEGVWSCNGAEQIMRVLDVGDPVAQRLIDGILENTVTQRDFHDFGSEHAHAGHIQGLTAGIDLTHVDTALQTEHGAYGGSGHTMLTRTGFGDDAGLAHALDQQRLSEGIVDLVCAGVVQILALEEDPGVQTGFLPKALGKTRSFGQWRRTAHVLLVEPGKFLMEFRIGLGLCVDAFELVKRRNQRLRHVASTELAEIWTFMCAQRGLFGCFHSCSCLY